MQISTHHQPTTTPTATAADTVMPGTKTTTHPPQAGPTLRPPDPRVAPVVLSEPQQGAHRPHRTTTERRVPATPPHSRVSCTCGAGSAGPNSPVSPPTEQPRPDIGGPQGLSGPGKPLPGQVLLRKEVIQPHLPVRLPCYDFVPIASPTFDGSPPCGLGHRLRVLPTFVT